MKEIIMKITHPLFANEFASVYSDDADNIKIVSGRMLFNILIPAMNVSSMMTMKLHGKTNAVGYIKLSQDGQAVFLAGIGSHNYIKNISKYKEIYESYKARKIFNKKIYAENKRDITSELVAAGRAYLESFGMDVKYLFAGTWIRSEDLAIYKGEKIKVANITAEHNNMGVMAMKFIYKGKVFFLGVTDTMTNRLASEQEKELFKRRLKAMEELNK